MYLHHERAPVMFLSWGRLSIACDDKRVKFRATVGDREVALDIRDGNVSIDGREIDVSFEPVGPSAFSLLLDGRSLRVLVERVDEHRLRVTIEGRTHLVSLQDEHDLLLERFGIRSAAAGAGQDVRAPMPGLVRALHVGEGDEVEAGARLVVLEAMKMENELLADIAGTVQDVAVAAGDTVEKGQHLLRIEAPDA